MFVRMGAAADVVHLPPLDVHAADEHRLGPGEIVRSSAARMFSSMKRTSQFAGR